MSDKDEITYTHIMSIQQKIKCHICPELGHHNMYVDEDNKTIYPYCEKCAEQLKLRKISEIITMPNGTWWHKDQYEAMRKFKIKQMVKHFRLITDKTASDLHLSRSKANRDNRKYAFITVGRTRIMAMVDNITNEAYKLDGLTVTICKWPKFKFDRWITMMEF